MQTKPRLSRILLATAALGLLAFSPACALAQAKPLITIRFNQARVYYDQQLYNAISQAVEAKPDVMFDVVSTSPATGNAELDQKWVATASHNTQAVVNTLQRIGVPMERLRVTGTAQAGLRYDETQIFAR